MIFRKKTKKRTSSRFIQASFQGRVKQASGYRRNSQGFLRDLQVLRALAAHVRVLPLLGIFVVTACIILAVYYPPLLHIRRIVVQGLPPTWASEVQQQAERYVADSRLFLFPGRHLALVDKRGLAEYLTTVNAHVERIDAVVRRWPHTLEVRAVPRFPAYAWSADRDGVTTLISNDGKILPESERGEATPLRVYGSSLSTLSVGGQAFGGDLLKALEVVRVQFTARTGLGSIAAVRLVPLVAVTPAPLIGGAVMPTTVPLVHPAVTHELWLEVPADSRLQTSDFVVLLDMATAIPEALDRLRVLLEKQSIERRKELAYVDVRFSSRAYLCVRSAACANAGLQLARPVPVAEEGAE